MLLVLTDDFYVNLAQEISTIKENQNNSFGFFLLWRGGLLKPEGP